MDLSPLRKWEVLGPDAETLIQWAITRDARRLAVGHVVYTAVCNETGGMIDDATVFRLGDDNFRFIGGDDVQRRLAQGARRAARAARVREAVHRPAAQPRRPGPREPRAHEEARLDAPQTQPAARRAQVVPLPRRALRRLRRDPGRGLAHGLHRRARLRGVLPPRRRPRRLGRDLGGRSAARPQAAGARGARHDPHRGRADLRGLRVRRPGRPVRGRASASRSSSTARTTSSARTRSSSARRIPSAGSSGSSSRATRPPGTATRSRSAAGAWASSPAARAARRCARTSRCAAWRCSTPRTAPTSRWASSTGSRSGSRPKVVRFPFYDPDKTRPRS